MEERIFKEMRCPNCGKKVLDVKPANFAEGKYFAFAVHHILAVPGFKGRVIQETEGCHLTKDEFIKMTEVPVEETDPD